MEWENGVLKATFIDEDAGDEVIHGLKLSDRLEVLFILVVVNIFVF